MFEPPLALASLSGEADSEWALSGAELAGAAFLGGIALDEPAREAARTLVDRDREEFLPADPFEFIERHLSAVVTASAADGSNTPPIRPAINVRSTTLGPIRRAATICAAYGAILEINAHCRQPELRAVGCGETLLADTDRLAEYVSVAAAEGADVSVKVRAEVDGVDLTALATLIAAAGADAIHIDAMDSPSVIEPIAATTELFVIANNGVRDRQTVQTYFDGGADAVSVGRPSREPDGPVMQRISRAVTEQTAGNSAAEPAEGHAP